ncbi:MAG TPA: ATP-binding protein [Pirellulales bacterium]|nr:ATP-binding protein [Pirellulales bacterium]
MMNDPELLELLTDLESDRSERKASLSDRDRIRQAVCAFANDLADHRKPGVIFVGVHDDGTCANLPITDELLRTLADIRSDGNILPFPIMSVQKRSLDGCEMAVIEVHASYSPPVRYNGRVWIRIGPRRGTATADEERRLAERRRAGDLPFDQQPARGAGIDDLDLDLFSRIYLPSAVAPDVLAENDRPRMQQLASLHFLTPDGTPNIASLLVFGKDPTAWIPGAYVQFVRFDGVEITDPIKHQKEITGRLHEQLLLTDEVLEANVSVASDVTSAATETKQPDYPIVALQQLSRNAILHRAFDSTNAPVRVYWFSDRIEIHSPGGPYGQVNAENFGQPGVTDYRNPLLAEAMKSLGFVQRFGLGIPLARKELEKNGNPPLEHVVTGNAVLAILRRRP